MGKNFRSGKMNIFWEQCQDDANKVNTTTLHRIDESIDCDIETAPSYMSFEKYYFENYWFFFFVEFLKEDPEIYFGFLKLRINEGYLDILVISYWG